MALKDLARKFVSQQAADLETIGAKLDTARGALDALEQEHREKSLDFALSEDSAPLVAIESKLADARRRVETYELAEAEAQKRENARLAEAASAAEKARVRAVQQHVGALVQAAAEFTTHTEGQVAALSAMRKNADKIAAASRNDELRSAFGSRNSPRDIVDQHADLEAARLCSGAPWMRIEPLGSFSGLVGHGHALSEVSPLAQRLRARFGGEKEVTNG
jgi:hypothetical protein